jgi:hypothetical protein
VNLSCLIGCDGLPAENAVPKNPTAGLKNKHLGFYTSSFCKFRALIAGQNGSAWQKNLSI